MNNIKRIDKLLAKFYSADITQKEMDVLFHYFIHTNPLPRRYADDELLIRSLATERYYYADKENMPNLLLTSTSETPSRHIILRPMVRYATIATGVAATVLALMLLKPATAVAQSTTMPVVHCNDNCDSQYIIDQFETSVYIK